jgi:hypothetical protein
MNRYQLGIALTAGVILTVFVGVPLLLGLTYVRRG